MSLPLENEEDSRRWSRRKWFAVTGSLVAVQLGLLYAATSSHQKAAVERISEPQFAFATPSDAVSPWLEAADPMLFAGPNAKGVSGLVWMKQPARNLLRAWELPPVDFLSLRQARSIGLAELPVPSIKTPGHRRPATQLSETDAAPQAPGPSELRLDGFNGRQLARPITLPPQFHTDVVSNTVVSATVDADGFVLSARVVRESGLEKADADALSLARRARFESRKPAEGGERGGEPGLDAKFDSGKLIFEWHALHLSDSNVVKRTNAR